MHTATRLRRQKLANEDKMRIDTLREQRFGDKAMRASYLDKNWSWNALKTICHWVDETGSAVTRCAGSGRLICHKSSCLQQSCHSGQDFDRMLLQLVDNLDNLFNVQSGQQRWPGMDFHIVIPSIPPIPMQSIFIPSHSNYQVEVLQAATRRAGLNFVTPFITLIHVLFRIKSKFRLQSWGLT